MKYLIRNFTIMLCLLIANVISAQMVHKVAAGTDGITAALAVSMAGDIIELTTSGGEYLENNTLNIYVGVTIRAAAGLAEKPILKTKGQHFFQIQPDLGTAANWWFKLDGLEFNTVIDDTTRLTGKCISIVDGTVYYDLSITNCYFQNFSNKIIWPDATTKTTYCDTLIFNQNMLVNCSDVARMQTACAGTVTMIDNTIWINDNTKKCMFLFMFRGQNDATGEWVEPNVTIKNITRYGGVENYPFINLSANNAVIENIIASNRGLLNGGNNGGQFRITGENIVLSNLLMDSLRADTWFRINDIDTLGSSVTIDSTTLQLNVDPMFEDPENGNFNLKAGSPAIGAAADGGNLGDRRWTSGAVGVNDIEGLPTSFNLEQNYPNPFNPTTNISFAITEASNVKLQVINILGQVVTTLVNEQMPAGYHSVNWNAADMTSGVYFYRLTSNKNSVVKKMLLLK